MLVDIINRLLITALFMCCLTTLRHAYYFAQAYLTSTEEVPVKYRVSNKSLIFLCLSLAYIISVFFTGIKLN
jgi:hypothetical protein